MAQHQARGNAEPSRPDYIPPVSVAALGEAAEGGSIDPGWASLAPEELRFVGKWRAHRGGVPYQGEEPQNLAGLSLSGGGIRSATLSLGIMQALAERGLLQRMDYISTVSGGGYIGSAVSWLISAKAREPIRGCGSADIDAVPPQVRLGLDRDGFPFGADDPAPDVEQRDSPTQRGLLDYLRRHGYYLTPGNGITIVSLFATVLRGTLLNLLVWLPALVLFFLFGLWASGQISARLVPDWHPGTISVEHADAPAWMLLPRLLGAIEPSRCVDAECKPGEVERDFDAVRERLPELLGFELFLDLALAITALLVVGSLMYSVLTWIVRTFSIHALCHRYSWRRRVERTVAFLIPTALAMIVIGTLPVVGVYLYGWSVAAGPLAVISGIAMTLHQFFTKGLSIEGELNGWLVSIGAGLFLYGFFLLGYEIAFLGFASGAAPGWEWLLLAVWIGGFGWFVNLNYISIHRFYRDRLMETFMPDIPRVLANATGKAVGADSATLQDVGNPDDPRGPLLIVNTNCILVDSEEQVYRQRGGDNFILTPLYCGSNATGWRRTDQFMDGRMTLSTAVAISGAALNPNAGVGGEGLTRNRVLSLVMYLLNLRLGYWACHPSPELHPRHSPNHFLPGLYAFGNALGMPGLGLTERRAFLQLGDGGQFENMAVYELVRRRLGLIIVCDGGADPEFSFSDFQTTVRRIQADFGARVQVHHDASPDQMIPLPDPNAYPKDAGYSKRGYMVCTIHYAGGGQGTLLFLKSALIRDVSFRVKGYSAQYKEFPDQSTLDQFFDEVQFESYRELGYRIACQMLDAQIPHGLHRASLSPDSTIQALIEACTAP